MKKGFTLIEILIVVAIIAILASVVLVGLGPTQQAGRDARRISDLHEVQNGLELYFQKCGYYPGVTAGPCDSTASTGYTTMAAVLTGSSIGVSTIPEDPMNTGSHVYEFATNGANATQYVLQADLENASSSVFISYSAPSNAGSVGSGDKITAATCAAAHNYCISL